MDELLKIEIRTIIDKHLFLRPLELEGKTEEQQEKMKDRWAIEDAVDKLASVIRSMQKRHGWFF